MSEHTLPTSSQWPPARYVLLSFVLCLGLSVRANTATNEHIDYASGAPMRPHLLITAHKVKGLMSVAELRESTKTGHGRVLWEAMQKQADADLKTPPIHPKGSGANYLVCNWAMQRVLRHALAFLITEKEEYKNAALEQIDITFNTDKWPKHWRDDPGQPKNLPAGLRVGQLCAGIGLAYDWLYSGLTPKERARIVAGLNRQGIQPFIKTVKQGNWQVHVLGNFMPAIVGGVGIAAMGLGKDHPDSEYLLKVAAPRMRIYLGVFGPEGEWNESVGYSGSVRDTVKFFSALRYWSATRSDGPDENILGTHPLPQFCRWKMYMTLPHGRVAKLGDCPDIPKVNLPFVPAVAAASRDGVLQWFYLNHLFRPEETRGTRDYVLELIGYDPTLKPLNPEGRMLHGHAFAANTMCVSSRTNWNPLATPCVVYGKGGAAYEVHGHHDVGQVCIDGFGKRLIVDAGGYASNNKEFYAASSHNVLTFNGQDMIEDRPKSRACFDQAEIRDRPALRAKLLASEFDDKRGGYWVLDTTDVYEGVAQARRMVVHLNPGVVVVLDTAALDKPGDISLRWHTADKCKPDAGGRFVVRSGRNISLESQVSHLGDEALAVARGEHQETRAGYVEASLRATRCTLLTLFCVSDPSKEAQRWKGSKGSWSIQTAEGVVDVRVSNTELSVAYRNILSGWRIRRSGK